MGSGRTSKLSAEARAKGPRSSLRSIQYLRGFAALMVVPYYGSRFISPYGMGMGDVLYGPAGMMGVVLFFIVSGFIMVYTTTRSDRS